MPAPAVAVAAGRPPNRNRPDIIVVAAEREQVERFMAVFARLGGEDVRPASSSEEAVARAGGAAGGKWDRSWGPSVPSTSCIQGGHIP